MPLHPQIRSLLDGLAAMGGTPLDQLPVAVARRGFRPINAIMAPSTAKIASVIDRRIEGPAGEIPLRLYTPPGRGPFPVLLYFHGGGFVIGDLDDYDGTCRELCDGAGCIVVSVGYRLAPEHRFPAATDDCLAATRWVGEHAAAFDGDPDRIAVGGDSAGGNLATVTALRIRDEGGPALCAQLLVYPVTDHVERETASMRDNADGYLLTRDTIRWFANHYLGPDGNPDDARVCPLRAVSLADLPPALVLTAEYDPLRDEGEAYAEALRAAGVATTLSRYDGAIHGFFMFYSVVTLGRAVMDESCSWLRQQFASR
jgi:acetyl esterase